MSEQFQPPESELRSLLLSASFSGVVAVTWEGQPVLEFAAGLANRQTGKRNEMGTRFATASVSKMFTALCIARLVDAGLCGFEQPLVEIVPMLRSHVDAEVTLASLLSHTSGLGDYIDDDAELPFAGMDVARLDCVQAFLPQVLAVRRHAPGTFFYSSAGYILLGLAIETLTGESFPKAISRWLTEPAGLHATGFPSMVEPEEDMAIGYLPDGQPNIGHLPIHGGPDGGIVTTAEDMQRLIEALASGGLISESAWQFLGKSVSPVGWQTYGHGFYITPAAGRIWHGHTGSDPGVSARVAFAAGTDSSIVVLCNVESVAFRIWRLALQWLEAGGPALKQGLDLRAMSETPDTWQLTSEADTSAPGCDVVRQWLREHNWKTNPGFMERLQQPEHEARPLVLLAVEGTRTVGGLFAETQLSWLRISIMAVDPERRSQGIGAALLAEAEREAVRRGCRQAYVDTMEYQAPKFYEAHGFAIVGRIPDWDSGGHAKLYLTKRLGGFPEHG